jgi:hypothetical protein
VDEHPRYRMWKDRLDEETARQAALVVIRAEREKERAAWYVTWQEYKAHSSLGVTRVPGPRWWNVRGWVLWLLRLHSPGRPG